MIALFARAGKQFGMGHLKRLSAIYDLLSEKGFSCGLYVVADPELTHQVAETIGERHYRIFRAGEEKHLIEADIRLAIIDMRTAPQTLLDSLHRRGIASIVFDDYANGRKTAECIISPLPHYLEKQANLDDYRLNFLNPEIYRQKISDANGILISFGGSDPAGAGEKVALALSGIQNKPVWLIEGPLIKYKTVPTGTNLVRAPESLIEYYAKCDTVFTSIGLTMLEALALHKRVIVMTPARYHHRIAEKVTGIEYLGMTSKVTAERIRQAYRQISPKQTPHDAVDTQIGEVYCGFVEIVGTLEAGEGAVCPVCSARRRTAMQRDANGTLFQCDACFGNYRTDWRMTADYSREEYFSQDYISRYGKSYEADMDNLRAIARRRILTITSWMPVNRRKLLDVGSALGVFADEANRSGFAAKGAEINASAVEYSKRHFGLEILPDFEQTNESFDIITMWYTLEHIAQPEQWIRKAHSILNDGGMIALGLPNGNGLFARANRVGYVKARPSEHCFEPSIRGIKRLLRKCGFTIEKIEIYGLHPERAGLPDSALARGIQKTLHLGDTFEIYARKAASSDSHR